MVVAAWSRLNVLHVGVRMPWCTCEKFRVWPSCKEHLFKFVRGGPPQQHDVFVPMLEQHECNYLGTVSAMCNAKGHGRQRQYQEGPLPWCIEGTHTTHD